VCQQYPTVVFVHGFWGDRSEHGMFTNFATALTAHGFLVYSFDLSGCGESRGDYEQTSLTKLAQDLRAVIGFVRGQSIVDQSRFGLLGFSLGTTTILALHPRNVRAVVLAGAVAHPYETLRELFGEGFDPEGISTRFTSLGHRASIGPQFWQDLRRYDTVEDMRMLHVPTLLLHGAEDDIVPIKESRALFEVAAEPKKLTIIPGDHHPLFNPLAVTAVVEWFEKFLQIASRHT